MAALPETRYTRSGDVHIAYQVLGDGPPDLVFVGGFTNHCEHQWEEPTLAQPLRRLASFRRSLALEALVVLLVGHRVAPVGRLVEVDRDVRHGAVRRASVDVPLPRRDVDDVAGHEHVARSSP
jgi:hypothetical protein